MRRTGNTAGARPRVVVDDHHHDRLAAAPLVGAHAGLRHGEERRRLSSRPSAVERIVGDAIAIVHDAMLTGQWERLQACQRDDCEWIYYDPTTTHAMRWCSTDPCGNVMKVRAYRARRAADADSDRAP